MTGRHKPRSRNGCSTCRIRKVKCDEQRPTCGGCQRMQFTCDWLRLDGVSSKRSDGKSRNPQGGSGLTKQLRPLKPATHDVTSRDFQKQADNPGKCEDSHMGIDLRTKLLSPCARLLPPLSPPNIPCSNSVLLGYHDRLFLQYFPASTVYYLHAPRNWGPIQYLFEVTAPSSSLVMRMMLAISASEMRRRGLYSTLQGSMPDYGLYYYTAALQELQTCVTTLGMGYHEQGLDEILATVFFMIQYGLQSASLLPHVKAHITGVRSLVTSYVRSLNQPGRKRGDNSIIRLPALSSRMLLWILYTDAAGTCPESYNDLMGLFSNPSSTPLSLTQLYKDARLGFPALWGDKYPVDCHVADAENLRPFDCAHRLHMIRGKIWTARINSSPEDLSQIYSSLMEELMSLRKNYLEDVEKARTDDNMRFRSGHAIKTAAKLVANYWACVLFCRRWLCPSNPLEPIHCYATKYIVDCLYEQHAQEKRRLVRFVWPIFVAAIETQDSAHRSWLLERLYENRNASAECEWSWSVANEISRQQIASDPSYIDLSQFVQVMDDELQ